MKSDPAAIARARELYVRLRNDLKDGLTLDQACKVAGLTPVDAAKVMVVLIDENSETCARLIKYWLSTTAITEQELLDRLKRK
jgi:hypothetical protein